MHDEKLKRLTKKQRAMYDKVRSYIERRGVSPTLEELRQMLSFRSLTSVLQYLTRLERLGLITRQRYRQRSIEIKMEDDEYVIEYTSGRREVF